MSSGEVAVAVGPDHQVHPGHLLQQRGAQALRHAADHAEDAAGPLVALQLAHPPDHPLLGVVAHGAGVDQHDVGVRRLLGPHVALPAEHPEHELGVGHVHLAAVGLDVDPLGHGLKIAGGFRPRGVLAHGRTATPNERVNPCSSKSPVERER